MSVWSDRVRGSPIWQQLETLGPAIDQAQIREGVDAAALEALDRLKTVLAFAGKRLAGIDHSLVQPGPIENIAAAFQSAVVEVQGFVTDGSIGHLNNANVNADTALGYLVQLNFPFTSQDLAAIREGTDSYRAGVESNLRQVEGLSVKLSAELEALRARLAEMTAELTAEKQRLSALASDHQSQFSSSQEARNREYADAQKSRQDAFASLVADYTQRLVEQNAEFSRQRETIAASHTEEVRKLTEAYQVQAQAVLDRIDEQRKDVEKLVGVIGNLGITSGYQKMANEARNTVRFWQAVTVLSLGALIYVAARAFLPLVQGSFTWEGFAGRVFLSLTVGVLAAYAGSQADRYQAIERRNRKLALELEALGPYLAPLSPE